MIESLSATQIFFVWLAMVVVCGALYWLTGFSRHPGLVDSGRPIAGTFEGLLSALYFSFVTTTSVGYGDVLPIGPVRIISIFEAVTGLLLFGALVAKFVSRRQDELVRDIYNVTFEARLDRVQTNLHLVLSELQSIAMMCDEGVAEAAASRHAAGERGAGVRRRTPRDPCAALQPPTRARGGGAGSYLIALASALRTLSDVMVCLPLGFDRAVTLENALGNIRALADDICAECVPQVYAPSLTMWMDRIQETARKIV